MKGMSDDRPTETMTVDQGNLATVLSNLDTQLGELNNSLKRLEEAMAPVLLPYDPRGESAKDPGQDRKEMSPAASYADDQVDRVMQMRARIESLIYRVDA